VQSAIVCPRTQNNFPALERLREDAGADLLFLYDVSPPGSIEELERGLREHPHIAILDHHGAAAARREVPGRELTAAEVAISGLLSLESRGVFHGDLHRVLLVTHSMNIDPDAFITRLLLKSYFDPDLHDELWPMDGGQRESYRWQIQLIEAARIGDTRFFGGYDYATLTLDRLNAAERLAVAIFQFIIEEKENCVIHNRKIEAAVLHNLQKLATNSRICGGEFDRNAVLGEIHRFARDHSVSLDSASLWHVGNGIGEDMDLRTAHWYDANLLAGERLRVRSAILDALSRSDIREVFVGRKHNPDFPEDHPPLFNENYIDEMGKRIGAKIMAYLKDPHRFEGPVRAYLDGLRWTKQIAERYTEPSGEGRDWLSVTVAPERLDLVPGSSDKQFTLVYDWLREAAAAFGGAYLHLMVRPSSSSMVISSRFPRPEEQASYPVIRLNDPAFCGALIEEERHFAQKAGVQSTAFLFKPNLVLPLGPLHIPRAQVIATLESHMALIMPPDEASPTATELNEVILPDGTKAPFDGTRWVRL
jgi:hypothetical protein